MTRDGDHFPDRFPRLPRLATDARSPARRGETGCRGERNDRASHQRSRILLEPVGGKGLKKPACRAAIGSDANPGAAAESFDAAEPRQIRLAGNPSLLVCVASAAVVQKKSGLHLALALRTWTWRYGCGHRPPACIADAIVLRACYALLHAPRWAAKGPDARHRDEAIQRKESLRSGNDADGPFAAHRRRHGIGPSALSQPLEGSSADPVLAAAPSVWADSVPSRGMKKCITRSSAAEWAQLPNPYKAFSSIRGIGRSRGRILTFDRMSRIRRGPRKGALTPKGRDQAAGLFSLNRATIASCCRIYCGSQSCMSMISWTDGPPLSRSPVRQTRMMTLLNASPALAFS